MGYMFLPLRRYFDFSGRSRRLEYWMFVLLWTIIYLVLFGIVFSALFEAADEDGQIRADGWEWFMSTSGGLIPMILLGLFMLLTIIPMFAVQVRRFHDLDKSGAWVLVNFIPLGSLVVLVMMFLDGTPGPNRYGPDPKNRSPLHSGYGAPAGYPGHAPQPGAVPHPGGYPGQPSYGGHPANAFPPQPGQPYPPQPGQPHAPQGGSGWPQAPAGHDPNGRPLG
jgi:uncharacterized membrane protein YhaH (DUF805 family)